MLGVPFITPVIGGRAISTSSGRISARIIVLRIVEIARIDFLHPVGPAVFVLHSTGLVNRFIGVDKGIGREEPSVGPEPLRAVRPIQNTKPFD